MRDKRLPGGGDRGVEPRARPGARRGRRLRRRGVHESHRRSPRLSQDDGRLRRRQGEAVRVARRRGRRGRQCRRRVVRPDDRRTARRGSSASASASAPTTARATSHVTAQGTRFILHTPDGQAEVSMPLIGKHNIENALAAAALVGEVVRAVGPPDRRGPARCARAPRAGCSRCEAGQPFAVLVDYAHTDDALENVLSALRPLTKGKLRVLFGCGGDRDRTKRPRMAQVAEKYRRRDLRHQRQPAHGRPATRSSSRSSPGFSKPAAKPVVVEPDRRAAIERIIGDAAGRRRRADRRQGSRELPDHRDGEAPLRRRRRSAARVAGAWRAAA